MPSDHDGNNCTGSTTWEWRRVRVRRPPKAMDAVPEGRRWFFRLPRWNPRTPLTLRVTYRGGAECWYEIHARGGTLRVPGVTALHDAMVTLYGSERNGRH